MKNKYSDIDTKRLTGMYDKLFKDLEEQTEHRIFSMICEILSIEGALSKREE